MCSLSHLFIYFGECGVHMYVGALSSACICRDQKLSQSFSIASAPSFILRSILFFICVFVCTYLCKCPWMPEECIETFEPGVAGDCEPLNLGTGNQILVLSKISKHS